MRIALEADVQISGITAVVHFADGSSASPLEDEHVDLRVDTATDRCGTADRLHLVGCARGIQASVTWGLYRTQPVVSVEMTVANTGREDALLSKLIYLDGLQPNDGFTGGFPQWPQCRFLNQPFHWEEGEAAKPIPADQVVTAHWSTVVGMP